MQIERITFVEDGVGQPSVKASSFFNGSGTQDGSKVGIELPSGQPLRSASRAANRISDVLFRTREASFSSIATIPSNADAVDAGLLFVSGIEHFVVLVGPSGSGKSHLLGVMTNHLRQNGHPVEGVRPALEHLRQTAWTDADCPLLLDDCEEIWNSPKQKMAMRLQLERRVRAGRPTVLAFTQDSCSRTLSNLLPQRREWRVAQVTVPTAVERIALVEKMAKNEGLDLAPNLVRIMAAEIPGSASALCGALKNLKLVATEWTDCAAVLRSLSLIDPYFGSNSGWDLRRRLVKLAKDPTHAGSGVNPLDLALYVLVYVVGMPEAHVETGLSLAPGEVYRRASRFRRDVETNAEVARVSNRFVEAAVLALVS